MPSDAEQALAWQLRAAGLPDPVREYRFAPPRRWRFDFAYLEGRVAIEVDGAVFSGGRHTRGTGFVRDLEKLNEAALAGWLVLRFVPSMITDGTALTAVELALRLRGVVP